MASKIKYIKVCQLSKCEFQVETVCANGNQYVEALFDNSVDAEKRAERMSEYCNCDWGTDY